MNDIEQLATALEDKITLEWYTRTERIYPQLLEALATAYALGRASVNTPARVQAARKNGAKNNGTKSIGRPKGAKDNKPRKPGRWTHNVNETNETEMKP